MHTNAGMVTALQQAVAHLTSALETLTDINMLTCTCSYMDAWIYASVCTQLVNMPMVYIQCATLSTQKAFYIITGNE